MSRQQIGKIEKRFLPNPKQAVHTPQTGGGFRQQNAFTLSCHLYCDGGSHGGRTAAAAAGCHYNATHSGCPLLFGDSVQNKISCRTAFHKYHIISFCKMQRVAALSDNFCAGSSRKLPLLTAPCQ